MLVCGVDGLGELPQYVTHEHKPYRYESRVGDEAFYRQSASLPAHVKPFAL